MAITEESRHRLYQALEEKLGHEEATTLMEHLPPVGWADVATKRDIEGVTTAIDRLAAATRRDIDSLRAELTPTIDATVHREISSLKTTFVMALVTSNATLTALVFAAARLV